MYTKEEAQEKIKALTENLAKKLNFIKTSHQYNVKDSLQIIDTGIEFIKPLFGYLNWNISNDGIVNPIDKEFIVLASGRDSRISKRRKEPDYLLQLNGKRRFYIEAKHPKYDLKKRTDYIWQAYSYTYSTQTRPSFEKVDFALLTDFEEFRFFDCTFSIKNNETLNNYCVIDWTYKDYIDKFDSLWEYFEKENVRNGSLEGKGLRPSLYIDEKKIKENRIPPDKAFLLDLDNEKDGWRIKLAKDIYKSNPQLKLEATGNIAEFITQVLQLILDRFIFIKVLADREIEEDYISAIVAQASRLNTQENYSNKQDACSTEQDGRVTTVYEICKNIFEQLDKTYNGSIFSFRDDLDSVVVSKKILSEILKDFLPENSRYNFKVIPIEILGTIYEQFLGKIVITTEKRAKIEYKPEIRKAGGIYYTPYYIVNYIVDKTIGENLSEITKRNGGIEELLKLKICDPSCGSGSFLIAAYNALIQWTIDYYTSKVKNGSNGAKISGLSKEEKKLVYLDENNNVRLTSKIKKEILKSCIYGVDIDPQAVEVTKMSLSLKALEDTTHYEIHNELNQTCILPSLEGNIRCGNSLLEWESEFKFIFDSGGFDIIVGNPPWLMAGYYHHNIINFLYDKYQSAFGKFDLYYLFVEKSLKKLVSNSGTIGFIIPNKFFHTKSANRLRKLITSSQKIKEIIDFGYEKIFQGATNYSCILILGIAPKGSFLYSKMDKSLQVKESIELSNTELNENVWSFEASSVKSIYTKIEKNSVFLSNLTERFGTGVQTGSDKILILSKEKIEELKIENKLYRKILKGRDVKRYKINHILNEVIFPYKIVNSNFEILSEKEMKLNSNCYNYLLNVKNLLESRVWFSKNAKELSGQWYGMMYVDKCEYFTVKSIVTPSLSNQSNFMVNDSYLFVNGTAGVTSIVLKKEYVDDIYYILGLLNSKLIFNYIISKSPVFQGGYYKFSAPYLKNIPIIINSKYKDSISNLVLKIIQAHKIYTQTNSSSDKKIIENMIAQSEAEIDSLVYQTYNLSPEEIISIK